MTIEVEGSRLYRIQQAMRLYAITKNKHIGDAEAEVLACLYVTGNDVTAAIELYMDKFMRSEASFRNRLHRMRKKGVLTPLLPVDILRSRELAVHVSLD